MKHAFTTESNWMSAQRMLGEIRQRYNAWRESARVWIIEIY